MLWSRSIGYARTLGLGEVFAVSRHAPLCQTSNSLHNENKCLRYSGSHDAFFLRSPIHVENLDFKQNTWGGENEVIRQLKNTGVIVRNPCALIVGYHMHCSGQRHGTGARPVRENRELKLLGRVEPEAVDINEIIEHEVWGYFNAG